MKKGLIAFVCSVFFVAAAFAGPLPKTLEELPLYPGATSYTDPYSEPMEGQREASFDIAAAPEAVVAWYVSALASKPRTDMDAPPSVSVGSFFGPMHDVVYWELDSIEDGYADRTRTYEGKWIREQLKGKRKAMGEGYVSQTSVFWVYRKSKSEYIQFNLEIMDTTFDVYMNGDPETGDGRGQKVYKESCRIRLVAEPISEF